MAKFRKKPVVIDAEKLINGMQGDLLARAIVEGKARPVEDGTVLIDTLEGSLIGRPGDWLIRGVRGEFYPCRNDIFAATYEPAEDQTADQEYDAELRGYVQWNGRLTGRIYGDKKGRFEDGTSVTTSTIVSRADDIVKTRNSTYKLVGAA